MKRRPSDTAGSRAVAGRQSVPYTEVLFHTVRRRLGRYRGTPLAIECQNVDTAVFRDAIDFFLPLYGNRDWVWVDAEGREIQGAGWLASGAKVTSEVLWRAPLAYLRHRKRIRALADQPELRHDSRTLRRAVFLRTDHVFGLQAGGSVGHLSGVIGGLRREGVDVEVVSTDVLVNVDDDDRFHRLTPDYREIRNLPELPRLSYNEQLLRFLEARWSSWRPDFVYHRYSLHNYVGPALRKRYRVPYVCEYNGSFVWMNRHWGKRPLYLERLAERIEMLNLRAADLVVVVSRAMADEVEARGIAPEKVLVNPNGVDLEIYHPGVSGTAVRQRYGLGDKVVVGFIGTFGAWHGAEQLPRAAAHLKQRGLLGGDRPLHFLLIGDGEKMPEVRRIIEEHGLQESFTLTGRVPQTEGPAHLAACDILASPHVPNPDGSPFFGSPTKLFEYMAMGRAIVASDLDQIGEVLDHGETAWLVQPGDSLALAAGIEALMRDEALRSAIGAKAHEEARARYTWDAHTRRILAALGERLSCVSSAAMR